MRFKHGPRAAGNARDPGENGDTPVMQSLTDHSVYIILV